MTDLLDLDAIKADLQYASSGIDGGDLPYQPHALHAMRAAERLLAEVERLRQKLADMDALFELQFTRMGEATELWRQEDPSARALVMPDLGELLRWLMAKHAEAGSGALRWAAGRIDPGPRKDRLPESNRYFQGMSDARRGVAVNLRMWADSAERGFISVADPAVDALAAVRKPSEDIVPLYQDDDAVAWIEAIDRRATSRAGQAGEEVTG